MRVPKFPNVSVVGMYFRGPHAKAWAEQVPIGEELFYEREPENPYDPSAIKIMYNLEHVGYVERGQAAFIAPHIDAGVEFCCFVMDKFFKKNNWYPVTIWVPVELAEEEKEYAEEA